MHNSWPRSTAPVVNSLHHGIHKLEQDCDTRLQLPVGVAMVEAIASELASIIGLRPVLQFKLRDQPLNF